MKLLVGLPVYLLTCQLARKSGRTIVFQMNGVAYNGSNGWAWNITLRHLPLVNRAGGYFWEKVGDWKPERFETLPKNPLCDSLRAYSVSGPGKANQGGDGAWLFWLFDPRCLSRKSRTTTGSASPFRSPATIPRN